MVAEAGDTSSMVGSQSQANLTDYEGLDEQDVISDSDDSAEEEMDTGDNQVGGLSDLYCWSGII